MLTIKDGESWPLPNRFHSTNNICAIIYDQLTEVLVNKEFGELIRTGLNINEKHKDSISELEAGNIHVLDWMLKYDYNQELTSVLTKHLTLSILADFVNFIYESLNCARKGKISIAYSLLRRPFTDELLILEQLLVDNIGFVDRFFYKGDQKLYDPSKNRNQKQTIEKAHDKITGLYSCSSELIYKIRYDKSYPIGINGISNRAIHIVTTDPNYKTESQNLNFIFDVENEYLKYCEHYYFIVPLLLAYSVSVVDEIIFQFMNEEKYQVLKTLRAFRRMIAIDYVIFEDRGKDSIVSFLLEALEHVCAKCNLSSKLNSADFKLFIEKSFFVCPHCFTPSKFDTLDSIQGIKTLVDALKAPL
jgi:hypothetical protein